MRKGVPTNLDVVLFDKRGQQCQGLALAELGQSVMSGFGLRSRLAVPRGKDERRALCFDPIHSCGGAGNFEWSAIFEIVQTARMPERSLKPRFREYGLPLRVRTDNGVPFAYAGAGGLSALSIWSIKLGITPERIDRGQPSQNGRHERLHRTLEEATARLPAVTLRAQQQRFDAFRDEYNHQRPHEALGQQPPSSYYQPSPRSYPSRLESPSYPTADHERRVRHNGEIRWFGSTIYISQLLIGEPVGIYEVDEGWLVRYGPIELGLLDPAQSRLRQPTPPRRSRRARKF